MTDPSSEAALRAQIRRDVEQRMRANTGLSWHTRVFVLVNALLMVINFMTTPALPWFIFPLAAWGIGLYFHSVAVRGSLDKRARIDAEVEAELARRSASSGAR